ncbi:hypothetical protein [Streptomyces sp. NPDC059909]|uniref:hypothetical protein n=1 Tax=Streptomyces sp. NPDC059909 TaxID=3346998 RepID=UPI00364F35C7
MGLTAENIAPKYGVPHREQDEFAAESRRPRTPSRRKCRPLRWAAGSPTPWRWTSISLRRCDHAGEPDRGDRGHPDPWGCPRTSYGATWSWA